MEFYTRTQAMEDLRQLRGLNDKGYLPGHVYSRLEDAVLFYTSAQSVAEQIGTLRQAIKDARIEAREERD